MKKYILVIYTFSKNNPAYQFILDAVADITTSPYMKFREVGESIFLHFGCDMGYKELESHIKVILDSFSFVYLLAEHNDNLTVKLTDSKQSERFLSLDDVYNSKEDENTNIDTESMINQLLNTIKTIGMDEINFEIEGEFDETPIKNKKESYNMDEILDKINEKGLSSLNKSELNYLNSLSK